jgi:hypothetical protein
MKYIQAHVSSTTSQRKIHTCKQHLTFILKQNENVKINKMKHTSNTTAFGSNSDGAFDAIATFYCRTTDKPQTPSNVVSHDVVFPTT